MQKAVVSFFLYVLCKICVREKFYAKPAKLSKGAAVAEVDIR